MIHTCPTHNLKMDHTSTRYGARYDCPVDDCTVMCWGGPTSRPADQETRDARILAHAALDPLWKNELRRRKARSFVYKALAEFMGLSPKETHIGMFTTSQCFAVVNFTKIWER